MAKEESTTDKKVVIRAKKSLVGAFGIGCLAGEETVVSEKQAEEIISSGFANMVGPYKPTAEQIADDEAAAAKSSKRSSQDDQGENKKSSTK